MAIYNVRLIGEADGLDETIEVDEDEFIYRCFKQGFDIKKFGLLVNLKIALKPY
jgi:hypothetical protein